MTTQPPYSTTWHICAKCGASYPVGTTHECKSYANPMPISGDPQLIFLLAHILDALERIAKSLEAHEPPTITHEPPKYDLP
jgi:hypothetical protein